MMKNKNIEKEARERMIKYFKRNGKAWISDAAITLQIPFELAFKVARDLEREGVLG